MRATSAAYTNLINCIALSVSMLATTVSAASVNASSLPSARSVTPTVTDPEVAPQSYYIGEPPQQRDESDQANDPYEMANRRRFPGHVALHRYVFDPVEKTYTQVVPTPLRIGLHNFLSNLEAPGILANDILQGDAVRAKNTVFRFAINSTIGIGGILDPASSMGMRYTDNDFGQTLARYGVSDYPYLLIPVIGPSNPRDFAGKVVDIFLDPLHYIVLPGGVITSISRSGLHELDKRSLDIGELDQLSRSSADAYATERQKARAERIAEIGDKSSARRTQIAFDHGDSCATAARQRSGDLAFKHYDKDVQNRVYEMVYADCDSWRHQR